MVAGATGVRALTWMKKHFGTLDAEIQTEN